MFPEDLLKFMPDTRLSEKPFLVALLDTHRTIVLTVTGFSLFEPSKWYQPVIAQFSLCFSASRLSLWYGNEGTE